MRAALVRQFGGPEVVTVEDICEPVPARNEVVVTVGAAALNFFDTLMLRDRYQRKPPLPFSPGAEIAGTVASLGPEVRDVEVGDRVMAYVRWNGCRERLAVPATALIRVPRTIPDAVAAGLTVTYGTAMHALVDRAMLRPDESVAVLGAGGGAGLAAVEIATRLGARVIAAAGSAEKLALARDHGARETIDYDREDLKTRLRELTDGRGIDVVFDCVGGPYSEPALRAAAWGGRHLVIGFAAGAIPKLPLNIALLRGAAIVGVSWGTFSERDPERNRAHIARVLDWVAQGALKPHIHSVVPLEGTGRTLAAIEAREAMGKIVVKP